MKENYTKISKINKKPPKHLLQSLTLLSFAIALIQWGTETSQAIKEGLLLCFDVIIPAMFPFFILSNLTISLGLSHYLGKLLSPIMSPLFHLQGTCATPLILGLIGGYPVGAKTTVALYQSHQCTKEEANHLLTFANNAGPAFLLGVIATNLYQSTQVGILLYVSHLLSALLTGILFRQKEKTTQAPSAKIHFSSTPFLPAFLKSVTDALQSTLHVCAFILTFTVFLRLLTLSGILPSLADALTHLLAPLHFPQAFALPLLTGILELATAVSSTPLNVATLPQELTLLSFFLAWGGLSVHCQTIALLEDLSPKHYLKGKCTQSLLASTIAYLLTSLFPPTPTVISTFSPQETTEILKSYSLFTLTLTTFLFLFFFSKKGRKSLQKGVY